MFGEVRVAKVLKKMAMVVALVAATRLIGFCKREWRNGFCNSAVMGEIGDKDELGCAACIARFSGADVGLGVWIGTEGLWMCGVFEWQTMTTDLGWRRGFGLVVVQE